MSLRSIRALRKGGALWRKNGAPNAVAPIFDLPLGDGDRDGRLAIQKGIVGGDRAAFAQAMRLSPTNGAAPLLAAYHAHCGGDREEALRLTLLARTLAPGNVTARAMELVLALEGETVTSAQLGDRSLLPLLPVVIGPVQGELLRLVERRIVALAPDDPGAPDREDILRGPLGWFLDRFDDVALLIGWGAGHALNLLLHVTRPARRRAYAHVIAGDLAEGFHRREKARKSFLKAERADPGNFEAAESLIKFALEAGDRKEATRRVGAYAKTLAADDGDPSLRRWEADLAWLTGDYPTAVRRYRQVTEDDPYGWFPPYRLGLALVRTGAHADARAAFATALDRINPRLLEERLARLAGLL